MDTQGQTWDIPSGYGLLFIADFGSAGHKFFSVSNGNLIEISGKYDSHISVTRVDASTARVTRIDNTTGRIGYIFISFL